MVSKGIAHDTPQAVIFRDPSSFVVGELGKHQSYWEFILSQHPKKDEILSYIVRGVDILDFFVPFRDDFQGKFYDSAIPQRHFFLIASRVWISMSLLAQPSLTELRTVRSLFGEKLAQFSHPFWLCPLRWNQRNRECATISAF